MNLGFNPSLASGTLPQFDTLRITLSDAGCDSVISIMLTGRGIDSGLAADNIDFDSVLIGQCRDSSTFIGNPCGPSVIIDSILSKNPAFHLADSLPDTIPSLGSSIRFSFCPQSSDTGVQTDTITFYPSDSLPFTIVLHGIGVEPKPSSFWVHFTISNETVNAGETATVSITLDSSTLTGKHAIRGVVSFDPVVLSPAVSPNLGFPIVAQVIAPDSIVFSNTFSDTIDFSDPGSFNESIHWLALLGPSATTVIGLDLTADTALNVIVKQGSVTVTDCTGLNGEFSPGGDYAMGPIMPNPASEIATLPLTLGNDGYVEAGLYDMTGRLIENILEQSFTRGSYTINIPMSGLASARYMVVVSSLGWRVAQPFVVDR